MCMYEGSNRDNTWPLHNLAILVIRNGRNSAKCMKQHQIPQNMATPPRLDCVTLNS